MVKETGEKRKPYTLESVSQLNCRLCRARIIFAEWNITQFDKKYKHEFQNFLCFLSLRTFENFQGEKRKMEINREKDILSDFAMDWNDPSWYILVFRGYKQEKLISAFLSCISDFQGVKNEKQDRINIYKNELKCKCKKEWIFAIRLKNPQNPLFAPISPQDGKNYFVNEKNSF